MKTNILLVTISIFSSTSVLAHHGMSGQFDDSKTIQVSGTITKLKFVNPHAYVYFDSINDKGETENWACEMRAATSLKRSGWEAEMFSVGTAIEVEGLASRKSATGCYVEDLKLGDDVVLKRYTQLEENKGEADQNRPDQTAWGDPNIAGNWAANQQGLANGRGDGRRPGGDPGLGGPERRQGVGPSGTGRPGPGGMGRPGMIELSKAGTQAMADMNKELEDEGMTNVAGRLDCSPRDLFTDWTFDQHTNLIIQEPDTITLKYGFMDTVRVIHLDQTEHPAILTPSIAGHSIGHWEGEVLVVDTVGFDQSLLRRGPNVVGARSEQFHVTERISVDNAKGELTISYEAEDPLFWQAGYKQSGESVVYLADYPWEPYDCEDLSQE